MNRNAIVLYPARPVSKLRTMTTNGAAALTVVTMALLGNASAAADPAVTALTSAVTDSSDGIKAAVAGLALVVVTIALIVWASRKVKPHG